MSVRVLGVGSAVPARGVSNAELERRIDTSDQWIRARTGIAERRVLGRGEHLLDLMERAARLALERSAAPAARLDGIIVGTVSGEYAFPSTACELQARLGIDGIAAFDVSAACSGFLFALSTAAAHVHAGDFSTVLVVGADALTTMLDWGDRRTCVLFGDGAGAMVVQREDDSGSGIRPSGVLATVTHASGALRELLTAGVGPRGGFEATAQPPPDACIRMKGPELFRVAVRCMADVSLEVLERAGLRLGDVDVVVPHQANLRILRAVAERLGLPMEKMFVNVDRYGNTSAASVPIALDEAVAAGRLRRGDLVLLVACGGGLTWAASAIRW